MNSLKILDFKSKIYAIATACPYQEILAIANLRIQAIHNTG